MRFSCPEGTKIMGKSHHIHKNQVLQETDEKGEIWGTESKGGAWLASSFPSAWEPMCFQQGGGGGRRRREQRPPSPDCWLSPRPRVVWTIVGTWQFAGSLRAHGWHSQTLLPSQPPLGSCQHLPFVRNGGNSWDRVFPHYLQLYSTHTLPGSLPPSCSSSAVTCWVSVTPNCSSASRLLKGVFRPQRALARHTSNETCLPVRLRGGQDARLDHHSPPGFDKVFKSSLSWDLKSTLFITEMFPIKVVYSFCIVVVLGNKWTHPGPSGEAGKGLTIAPSTLHTHCKGGLRLTDIVQMPQNLWLWLQKKGMSSP